MLKDICKKEGEKKAFMLVTSFVKYQVQGYTKFHNDLNWTDNLYNLYNWTKTGG